ncbi:MAG: TIGR00282 family metallophosphoesterase [Candidatus Methylacidiphilales bacterium]
MRFIFLGDVVGEPGRKAVKASVPVLMERYAPDFVVVNGENAAGGSGITPRLVYELLRCRVDVITLGDHCWDQHEIYPFFQLEPRLIRPMNFPSTCPGPGYAVVEGNGKKLAVINALGQTFMGPSVENPFLVLDPLVASLREQTPFILVDFHAEATSEKIAMGRHLDGRVSCVVGTHTHVQTADSSILPGGTAYLTDAGFCGAHDSVIGRDVAAILERNRTQMPVRMKLATGGVQADGIFVELDDASGLALRIERIQEAVADTFNPDA